MSDLLEIRWHGRGGQGAKTASILLAKIASATGKYVQAFPEYGPERMGAPVLAYNRLGLNPVRHHCQIESPDVVIVLDSTLVSTVDVTANIKNEGLIIINHDEEPSKLKEDMGIAEKLKIYTVNANDISEEEIGRIFPNTPMLGAFNRVEEFIEKEEFIEGLRRELGKKFSSRPEIIEGNINAVKRAYQEVKGA